ncbi:MAG: nitrous oxide reductase accessory protein NosL [Candidatus Omnitrophica bacterium]|nr:nitrous oxide reductase accessory protein NosL [Candidatus Omnitrophota bacterium]
MRLIHRSFILAFLVFSAAGCGKVDLESPPKIRYGKDICSECGMIVSEQQFAAASVDQDGNMSKFDGIGCLILHQAKQTSSAHRTWVRDYKTEEWIEVNNAFFVNAENLVTPMGFGLIAFSSEEAARQFVRDEGGSPVGLRDLPALVQKKIEHV